MKTKIIYISGDDKFNISDIRAVFNEVRTALNLGIDTVLFGVPVDTDDALNNEFQDIQPTDSVSPEPIITEDIQEPIPEPVKTEVKKRGRKKATVSEVEPEPETNSDEKVIPILSVLGNNESVQETTEEITQESPEPVPESNIAIEHTVTENDGIVTETNTITVQEIISEPSEPTEIESSEKTLEELLESMKPLDSEIEDSDDDEASEEVAKDEPVVNTPDADIEDITLQQLATEFIESQDKIVNTTKSNSKSKIGKLKNILPFSKQKQREDTGLMGDLFGWAGFAANDEEFSMPDFFGGATKK
ncbi:MAG: hypothetical protein MJ170_04160 [Alphaproteobacteria bacterium]|nr:hypothetical protein [Alphaproteobacteria bacterium]